MSFFTLPDVAGGGGVSFERRHDINLLKAAVVIGWAETIGKIYQCVTEGEA